MANPSPANPAPDERDSATDGLAARECALALLHDVLDRHQPLTDVFDRNPAAANLPSRDRAFTYILIATTLRRMGQIDSIGSHFLHSPLPPEARLVRGCLRLGICQLVFLGTPGHAAVSTAVQLVRRHRLDRFAGLINAILRRVATEGFALACTQDSARLNTPDWLWQTWVESFGEETARAIATQHLTEPPLDLTPRDDAAKDALAAALGAAVLPTGGLRLLDHHGLVSELAGFAEGRWWVQDAAATLPAHLLGDVRGRRVYDLCAAPGGKTAQLAAAGANVVAVDNGADRMARLEANLARLKLRAQSVISDVADWHPADAADAVLLDAPCSATGTIRRHPDILHTKTAIDAAALAVRQRSLLNAAMWLVKPGGRLIYAVCSLQPEECQSQIERLLAEGAPVRREPIHPSEVGGLSELITPEGDLRTLPCHLADRGGLDGFYAARLIRI